MNNGNPRYQPYQPTKLESRLDKLVRLVLPQAQARRAISREREHYFRYLAALPTSSRKNSNAQTSGESMRGSREKMQVMWNAINAVDNSGICTAIVSKFQMYVCGTLRWQSRCGVRAIATQYEDYMKAALSKSLDVSGRYSLRQMAMLDLRSILVKGDVGTNIVRNGNAIQLQGIEADRIGDPYNYSISNNYVRGLELDDAGRLAAARVYYRDRPSGTYKYEQTIPFKDDRGLPRFLFLNNPISYDDYRGVSVFKTAIDNATYIDRIREYELQALMWAASQSGVYHTKSGALPEGLPFDANPLVDASGNAITTYQVRPNTVTALGMSEDINMFQHDRPSPNLIGIIEHTVTDISVGTGLSKGMVWDMSGYTGPAVRAISSQDARTIETWQWLIREGKLDPVALLVLGNAIANGELPYTPDWHKWEWFFPAKSTIDVGRESDANIAEIHAGIQTGARVAANDGQDIEEIKVQRGLETEAEIEIAIKIASDLNTPTAPVMWQEVYGLMYPRPGRGGQAMPGMTPPVGGDGGSPFGGGGGDGGGNGASAGRNGGGNGKSQSRMREPEPDQIWYSADQARDDDGKFADEGGGVATATKLSEDYGEKAPKVGEPFLVYRLGRHGKLENDNAGNSLGVANHLAMVDDMEGPSPSGGTGDRVMAFQVTPHEEWGDYEHFDANKGGGRNTIGRATTNQVAVYSFPKGGKFDYKKIAEVPLTDIRSTLKELHGTDNFDEAGARAGAEAIREAFKKAHNFKAKVKPEIWYRPDQARDKDGKFEDEGGGAALTGLDKKLIDYKPEKRSLSDPTKLVKIADILPNTRHVPYTQMPFFRGLSAMHGIADPEKVGGEEYKLSRDALMNRQPTTDLPYKQMVVTQPAVNKDRVAKMGESPLGVGEEGTALQPIHVVHYKGEDYILNGHHRLVDTYVKGGTSHPAKVLQISEEAAKVYESGAKAKPILDNLITSVAKAHDALPLTAPLKKYDGEGGALDKVEHDYAETGGWSQIKDVARGRIIGDNDEHVTQIAADMEKRLGIKPKYTHDPEGFTDYKFNPEIEGHKVEIGVLTKFMNKATETTHAPYKEKQRIQRLAIREKRENTPKEKARIEVLNNQMKPIFAKAAALGRVDK